MVCVTVLSAIAPTRRGDDIAVGRKLTDGPVLSHLGCRASFQLGRDSGAPEGP
jgi:hypothetical protein